ncbi:hypothetical protein H1230_09140 [Paenibacillus sp. 19GGS1-52]|uniref:Cas9 inhibitor AcrIIA9 family protein n=1 Tax=Paenibacillus sp. 19GGS1-52 TaxID=2758563 RepID=UPI001EFA81ED|nr:Cas9 inhibitor AcrIIA9 family protein [Paenibacillus sp. 19GGS1-52]ULO08915.1 hypothetical protein H1230_09140 [Paenibacillus sp. 19GGS1-52]
MEQALAKLKTEMDAAKSNAYVQLIGKFLQQHLEANPEAAVNIMTEGKTVAKSLEAMQAEAKKKQSGGMAMLTDAEGYAIVLKYYGIKGQPVEFVPAIETPIATPTPQGRFEISLDDLL